MLRSLLFLLLSLTCALAQDVRITEFLPVNTTGILDEDGTRQSWIEVWNRNDTSTVTLTNWALIHEGSTWTFPTGFQIAPGELVIIFASGKDRKVSLTAPLHTNFTLKAAGGGPLQLRRADLSIASSFATYPALAANISYGRDIEDNAQIGSYINPTPEERNNYAGPGVAGKVVFSEPSRAFTGSLSVSLAQAVPVAGATIRYTTNNSAPISSSPEYNGTPIVVSTTQRIRARVYQSGKLPGEIESNGYLLVDNATMGFNTAAPIVVVSNFGAGTFPDTGDQPSFMWVWEPGTDGRARISNLPTLASRTVVDRRGSSTLGNPKTNFNLEARKPRDEDDRDIELLGMPAGSDWVFHAPYSFDRSLVHNPFIYSLSNNINRTAMRSRMAEVFVKTNAGALTFSGGASGDYYGVYNVMEKIRRGNDRVEIEKLGMYDNDPIGKTGGYIVKIDRIDAGDTGFNAAGQLMAYYYPKEIEIKINSRDPQEQYLTQYFNSFNTALNSANYRDPVQGYANWIDVPAAIDHHLLNVWAMNVDALRLSGFMTKERNEKLVFGPIWDFDRALCSTDGRDLNYARWQGTPLPNGDAGTDFFNYPWWARMFTDPDFYQKYIDRWLDLRQGAFAPAQVNALLDALNAEITPEGVNRDLARWNQGKRSWTHPITQASYPASQAAEIQRIKDWLQLRAEFMETQWVAPVTLNNTGGTVIPGFEVTMSAAAGSTIYYTLDGTDPRPSGGAAPTGANVFTYSGPITVNSLTRIKARAYNASFNPTKPPGGNPPLVSKWSGLRDARYNTDPPATPATLAITEINYHPADPTTAELAIDPALDTSHFEFIELKNVGATPIDLAGVKLVTGAEFTINNDIAFTLPPGGFVILAANPAAFAIRYGNVPNVLGPFLGDLSNSGEQIVIKALDGAAIASFTYDDAWCPASDGEGPTMETKSQMPTNYHLPATWKASLRNGGTPGYDYELTITDQPASVAVNPGEPVHLEVEATGSQTPTFQWRKNGIPINGATGPTFDIVSATEADQGNYDVLVSNIGGDLPSNVVVVSVNDPVTITGDPQAQTVNPGEVVVFSVDFTGTSPSFQWRKGGVPLEGMTERELILVATENDEGAYDVVVTNMLGSKTSAAAALSVNNPVVITTQPETKTVNPGASVTFSVAGTGTAPIAFQWRKDTQPIDGAIGSELTFTASEAQQGVYDVVVSNIVGPVTSNPAPLIVNDPVAITDSPVSQTVNPGTPVSFAVVASGTGPFAYQWRKGGEPIDGAVEASYALGGAAEGKEGNYDVVVSNAFSSATSAVAILSVNDPAVITVHPLPQTVNPDTVVSFSVTATGTAPLSYQWRKDTQPIDGETGAALSFAATEQLEGVYDVVVTNMVNSVTSNPAALTVDDPVEITDSPDSQTVNPGVKVTLSVAATGADPLTYQWRKGGQPIGGASAASYVIDAAAESDQGTYDVLVSNGFSSVTSGEATLTVNDPVVITVQPLPQGVAPGGSATFSVIVTGTDPITYQWRKNETPIGGATGTSYQIASASDGNLGDYDVVVSNVVGSVTSDAATLSFVEWTAVAGNYQGLLGGPDLQDPLKDPYPGRVTATVAKTGKVTGKLEYLGLLYRFSMKLDANLRGSTTIVRKNATAVTLGVHLDSVNKALVLSASHQGTTELFEAVGEASQIPKRPKTSPAARAGRYTLLLTPGIGAPSNLTAPGFLTVNVAKTGSATWLGKLPDLTIVRGSAGLTPDDNLAIFTLLYPRRAPLAGYFGGPLALETNAVVGDFVWRKPDQGKGKFWPDGVDLLLSGDGKPYSAPARNVRVITPETVSLKLDGQIPNGTFERTLTLSLQNKFDVAPPNAEKVKLTLNRTTGGLTGSYFDSTLRATRKLEGVILQGDDRAGGFFPGVSETGTWNLAAPVATP